ncbi:hypothetical protein [Pleionea sediminis]|uniref:hypothetical protein n=1 Tax=Pleionea sediminis TaxID=2569479 RepID=UPI0011847215|nr:hypothetical protein [Pleionea sediminis]
MGSSDHDNGHLNNRSSSHTPIPDSELTIECNDLDKVDSSTHVCDNENSDDRVCIFHASCVNGYDASCVDAYRNVCISSPYFFGVNFSNHVDVLLHDGALFDRLDENRVGVDLVGRCVSLRDHVEYLSDALLRVVSHCEAFHDVACYSNDLNDDSAFLFWFEPLAFHAHRSELSAYAIVGLKSADHSGAIVDATDADLPSVYAVAI